MELAPMSYIVFSTQLQSRVDSCVIVHVVSYIITGLSTSTEGYVFRIVVSYIAMQCIT